MALLVLISLFALLYLRLPIVQSLLKCKRAVSHCIADLLNECYYPHTLQFAIWLFAFLMFLQNGVWEICLVFHCLKKAICLLSLLKGNLSMTSAEIPCLCMQHINYAVIFGPFFLCFDLTLVQLYFHWSKSFDAGSDRLILVQIYWTVDYAL